MPPLSVHCIPGRPSRNPGLRPIDREKLRSKLLDASNGVGAGSPYSSGSKSVPASSTGDGTLRRPALSTSVAGAPSTPERDGCGRHRQARRRSDPLRQPSASDGRLISPGRLRSVPSIATTRNGAPEEDEGLRCVVGVDEAETDAGLPATRATFVTPSRPESVSSPSSSWATTARSSLLGRQAAREARSRRAPNRPLATWVDDASWLWYQNVPVCDARNRYLYDAPRRDRVLRHPRRRRPRRSARRRRASGSSRPASTSRLTSGTSTRSPAARVELRARHGPLNGERIDLLSRRQADPSPTSRRGDSARRAGPSARGIGNARMLRAAAVTCVTTDGRHTAAIVQAARSP